MIKYKGMTSNLLTDISLQFGTSVNLKQSEAILKHFFFWIAQHATVEEKVALICSLPTHIKPFCSITASEAEITAHLFCDSRVKKTILSVLMTLQKYIPASTFFKLCGSLPELLPFQPSAANKKVFLVA